MPYYEYHCPANGRTVEVRHRMDESLQDWKEVADCGGIDLGGTAPSAPVERLISAAVPLTGSGRNTDFQGCGSSCACAAQA